MSYVEWHDTVRGHWKTDALMAALGCTRREAVGIVGCLSSWAIQYRPGGLMEEGLVEVAIEWDGEDGKCLRAMLKVGWLDADGEHLGKRWVKIHDWEDITKNYRKSAADRERKREARGGKRRGGDVRGQSTDSPRTDLSSPLVRSSRSSPGAVPRTVQGQSVDSPRTTEPQEVTDDAEAVVLAALSQADIIGSDKVKQDHIRGWLRSHTANEVVALIQAHPGLDIYDLHKAAFREGTLSRGLTKPEKTTQLNAMHKGKDGQVPCPFCREMPGFVSVEGGRLKPCPTCKGSKYVDKVVEDAPKEEPIF